VKDKIKKERTIIEKHAAILEVDKKVFFDPPNFFSSLIMWLSPLEF
jgi:hypothetical protein